MTTPTLAEAFAQVVAIDPEVEAWQRARASHQEGHERPATAQQRRELAAAIARAGSARK